MVRMATLSLQPLRDRGW